MNPVASFLVVFRESWEFTGIMAQMAKLKLWWTITDWEAFLDCSCPTKTKGYLTNDMYMCV